ncbi:MAG: hypothetical protein ACOCWG_01665 [bacterium]
MPKNNNRDVNYGIHTSHGYALSFPNSLATRPKEFKIKNESILAHYKLFVYFHNLLIHKTKIRSS